MPPACPLDLVEHRDRTGSPSTRVYAEFRGGVSGVGHQHLRPIIFYVADFRIAGLDSHGPNQLAFYAVPVFNPPPPWGRMGIPPSRLKQLLRVPIHAPVGEANIVEC